MNKDGDPEKDLSHLRWLIYSFVLILLVLTLAELNRGAQRSPSFEIPYSEFKTLVVQDLVEEVTLEGSRVNGRLTSLQAIGPKDEEAQRFTTRLPDFGDQALLSMLEEHGVIVSVEEAEPAGLKPILISVLPWLIFLAVFFWLFKTTSKTLSTRMGGPGELKKFLSRGGQEEGTPDVTFDDVAGQDNAKREVSELVDFLKAPERFRKLGAEVPRGVLLMGAPGTGKTLMARALAGEAGVPFFSISGSEFIEVFVGVGAARVRNLFSEAKSQAPSIIFIDELDSVGRTRGTGLGGGHDEREQTLNQILAEMDGFTGHEAVVVLAATNRPDVLDPALLRPGRFDRHVTLDLPDREGRRAILSIHTRGVPLADDVDLTQVAAGTPGFSGADLRNLVNEAAMLAAHENCEQVTQKDFDGARDKLMLGTVRNLAIMPEEKHRLAVHEAGHAIVAYCLPNADPLYKVSIIPRGRTLGATYQLPESERYTLPEEYLRDRLAVTLGGYAAEKNVLGTLSSGADNDIHEATDLARSMVARWGMSSKIGPVDLKEAEEHPFLGREIAQQRHFSEHSAELVDEAVRDLLNDAEAVAEVIIKEKRQGFDRLVAKLEEEETLEHGQVQACFGNVVELSSKERNLNETGS